MEKLIQSTNSIFNVCTRVAKHIFIFRYAKNLRETDEGGYRFYWICTHDISSG